MLSFTPAAPGTISQTGSSPTDNSIVASLTPTLSVPTAVSLPSGDPGPAQYQFQISTGTDASSGQVVASTKVSFPSSGPLTWTVPPGVLQDGGSYTWTVLVPRGDGTNNGLLVVGQSFQSQHAHY